MNNKFKTYEEHLSHWINEVDKLKEKVLSLEKQLFALKFPPKFKESEIVGHYKILYADVVMEDYSFYNIYDVIDLNMGKRYELKESNLLDIKESEDFRKKRYDFNV